MEVVMPAAAVERTVAPGSDGLSPDPYSCDAPARARQPITRFVLFLIANGVVSAVS
jgi:hypothetical protein